MSRSGNFDVSANVPGQSISTGVIRLVLKRLGVKMPGRNCESYSTTVNPEHFS
ncbi:hypothetical protein [Thiolapillus brandeum]|uniref:hypothetical protein n=1 Tax=Thiolapillus brandeum TaxID=1076588 RepID=UPI0012B5C294|nr:hypothetical protein [Thiolapillus brandeum]